MIQKWMKRLLLACICGIIVGFVGMIFAKGLGFATQLYRQYNFVFFFAPLSGVAIIFLYQICKEEQRGVAYVFEQVKQSGNIALKTGFTVFIATILTHMIAGSSGREGASIQIGGSLGSWVANRFKADKEDKSIAMVCGMSACFAALFGTPFAAALFCIKGITKVAVIPAVISALIAARISSSFGIKAEHFHISEYMDWNLRTLALLCLLGISVGIISIVFCEMMRYSKILYKRFFKNPYIRIIVGSVIFILLTCIVGSLDYSGGGFNLLEKAMVEPIGYETFAVKLLFTAVVLGCGFRGGEIVPAFTVGGTFAYIIASVCGIPIPLAIACGMIGCFAGTTGALWSAIIMSIEIFGAGGFGFYTISILLSCGLVYGYSSLVAVKKGK